MILVVVMALMTSWGIVKAGAEARFQVDCQRGFAERKIMRLVIWLFREYLPKR